MHYTAQSYLVLKQVDQCISAVWCKIGVAAAQLWGKRKLFSLPQVALQQSQ